MNMLLYIHKHLLCEDTLYDDIKFGITDMFTDNEYAQIVYDNCIDDIVTDIKETAGTNYNNSDIRLAIQRVILKRMGFNI